jgi:hypothetical protein
MAKVFEVLYQCANAATGKNVQVDVYKPDKSLDAAQSGLATEIGTTGRYYKSFDADAAGWFVEISDNAGGKAIKHYDKDAYDSHGVAALVADVQTAVDNVASAISTLQSTVTGVDTVVDGIATDVVGITTAVAALETHLGVIEDKIDDLSAPPMVG